MTTCHLFLFCINCVIKSLAGQFGSVIFRERCTLKNSSDFRISTLEGVLDKKFCFTKESWRYRPTVSCILVDPKNKGSIILVQPKAGSRRNWILPQGGVGRNESVFSAIRREMAEELDCKWPLPHFEDKVRLLGSYINPARDDSKSKLIVAAGLHLTSGYRVRLNEENIDYRLVSDEFEMWHIMSGTRPTKLLATCMLINLAYDQGLLGWRCDNVLSYLRQEETIEV